MKITIDVGKEDVRNLIDSQDIAQALVEDDSAYKRVTDVLNKAIKTLEEIE